MLADQRWVISKVLASAEQTTDHVTPDDSPLAADHLFEGVCLTTVILAPGAGGRGVGPAVEGDVSRRSGEIREKG